MSESEAGSTEISPEVKKAIEGLKLICGNVSTDKLISMGRRIAELYKEFTLSLTPELDDLFIENFKEVVERVNSNKPIASRFFPYIVVAAFLGEYMTNPEFKELGEYLRAYMNSDLIHPETKHVLKMIEAEWGSLARDLLQKLGYRSIKDLIENDPHGEKNHNKLSEYITFLGKFVKGELELPDYAIRVLNRSLPNKHFFSAAETVMYAFFDENKLPEYNTRNLAEEFTTALKDFVRYSISEKVEELVKVVEKTAYASQVA